MYKEAGSGIIIIYQMLTNIKDQKTRDRKNRQACEQWSQECFHKSQEIITLAIYMFADLWYEIL